MMWPLMSHLVFHRMCCKQITAEAYRTGSFRGAKLRDMGLCVLHPPGCPHSRWDPAALRIEQE